MVKLFCDVGKTAKKLLSDDYVSDAKVSMKTKTANGISFTVDSLRLAKEDTLKSEVSVKYNVYGNSCTTKFGSAGKISTEAILDQLGVDGVKLVLNGAFGSTQGASAKIEYMHPHLAATALVDVIRGPSICTSAVMGVHGISIGGEVEYDTGRAEVSKYTAVVTKLDKDAEMSVWLSDKMRKIRASYSHDVNERTSVAGEMVYDRDTAATSLSMGIKYALDTASSVKARLDSSGLLSLAYITDLRAGTKVVLATKLDTQKIDASPNLGLHLTYEG